ncbi:MAG: elongation factor P maturation arginine rhamnosyltransferase EarP [Anaerolineae bacterium]|nr:elongation factor P maturation arginine rhamnosyltransferase EarP [Anaerolineae bacterium]
MRFHIYCTVIDNYGDIGVCWRLSRQLVAEYGCDAHLWVNDAGWAAARQLIRELPQAPAPTLAESVTVSAWSLACVDENCAGDVLIEGFGCTLPEATLAQLRARAHKPVWIDLEYFSAEDWVPRFHLQSGFDWEVGAKRWFFFPGVHEHSGGILRERDLIAAHMG